FTWSASCCSGSGSVSSRSSEAANSVGLSLTPLRARGLPDFVVGRLRAGMSGVLELPRRWDLGVVRVAHRIAHAVGDGGDVDDDLLFDDVLHRRERDDEIASIFDVDDELGPAAWQDFADGA